MLDRRLQCPLMVRLESRRMLSTTYVVSTTADSGAGSFRQAIIDANANPGADTINFAIGSGVQTITPDSPLPHIGGALTIDATTQGGYAGKPLIEINGASAGSTDGLKLSGGNNTVRGLVINRFSGTGLVIQSGDNNIIENCYIGTDTSGLIKQKNSVHGLYIGTSNNRIGGTTAAQRNVICGNDTLNAAGIFSYGGNANLIIGNYIGIGSDGLTPVPNYTGLAIFAGANNFIGNTTGGAGNVISGNKQDGVLITTDSHHNTVQQNFIGTDYTGTIAVPNGDLTTNLGWGIELQGYNNLIGGTNGAASRNILSGNVGSGLTLYLGACQYNLVQGNYIGTDVTGTQALANLNQGVSFSGDTDVDPTAIGPQFNTIGGTTAAERNIISGNRNSSSNAAGVGFFNRTGSNVVLGNYIGTDVTGTVAIPNDNGVALFSVKITNTIGGTAAGSANVISGNAFNGINIGADNTIVQGNLIGTDYTGAAPLPNNGTGIQTIFSSQNTIGGAAAGAGNVIAYNKGTGVKLAGGGNNTIQNNSIGVNITGAPGSNVAGGVWIESGAGNPSNNNTVSRNTIAHNGGSAAITITSGTGNRITANSIYNNGRPIDLNNDGITPNDNLDPDSGPNNLQNFPIISDAFSDTTTKTWISVTINSLANTAFTLDFYATAANNSSQVYLGSAGVVTNASGNASFNVSFNVPSAAGSLVAVTATAPDNSTSEFSATQWIPLPGDTDRSRTVDFFDLTALAASYGQTNKTWADGDFNNDGAVNFFDLTALAANYGQSLPAPAAVPEPAPAASEPVFASAIDPVAPTSAEVQTTSAPAPAATALTTALTPAPISSTPSKARPKKEVFADSPPIQSTQRSKVKTTAKASRR